MASIREVKNKKGEISYEISVYRKSDGKHLTTRWKPEEGWARSTIKSRLNKFALEYEQKVNSGEILKKKEAKESCC